MRIAFVSAVYPPESEPTAVMTHELAARWVAAGHEVEIVCPFPNRPKGEFYPGFDLAVHRKYDEGGVKVNRVITWPIGKGRKVANRLLENASFGVTSAALLGVSCRPDVLVVESWPIFATFSALEAARTRRIPVVNYIKDIYPEAAVSAGILKADSLATKAARELDRWICRRAAINVVISEGMRDHLSESRRLPKTRFAIVRDWLDLGQIRPFEGAKSWRREVGLPAEDFVCMVAGTLGLASGVDVVVKVADVLKGEANLQFVCVGEGVLKQAMVEEVERLNLRNVSLLPFQPRDRVAEMQSSADVMLLTTAPNMGVSSVPNKFITYLAVGKPILCAVRDDSELAAVVREWDVGLVVEPGSPKALAEGVLRLRSLGTERLRDMGRRARELALERYSLDVAVQSFERLFGEVTKGGTIPAD